jgi:hypothetical protein
VGFALGFVSAALGPNSGWEQRWSPVSAKKDASVDDLQSFVGNGLERVATLTGKSNWKSVVDPKSFKTDPSKPLALKNYEPGVIQAKLLKALKQVSSFEKKVCLAFYVLPTLPVTHLNNPHSPPYSPLPFFLFIFLFYFLFLLFFVYFIIHFSVSFALSSFPLLSLSSIFVFSSFTFSSSFF